MMGCLGVLMIYSISVLSDMDRLRFVSFVIVLGKVV